MTSKKRVTIEALRALMDNPACIRNMSVIAHVDHGKSTLTDSLLASNELIAKEDVGVKRGTDTGKMEQERGITIKSTGVSLLFDTTDSPFKHSSGLNQFLINLIDSPGHVDFSSEVTAALRLTDGALVLVDCVEGCCVQTETVLRQALQERIKPVLSINKLDRAFLELQLSNEEMYQYFVKHINDVNQIISTYEDEALGDCSLAPEKGNVAFSAGRHGWAFTLRDFARIYAKKLGAKEDKLMTYLWGENYFDPEAKKWITSNVSASGKKLNRGFCEFVLEPISRIFKACMDGNLVELDKLLQKINIQLTSEEKSKQQKELMKSVMQKWLPAADSLLEMMVTHLPSPAQAQKYRVENLYEGPLDDEVAEAIRKCDPNGPFVMFVSKLVPTKDNSRFFAFGRVFSGTASPQKVRIMGNNYVHGSNSKEDLYVDKQIQRIVLMMCGKTEPIDSVPCGNTCALVGVDNFLTKSGTVTSSKDCYPIKNMKFTVSPVVRKAVGTKNASDIPKLVEALKKLAKIDTLVQVIIEPTGEHIIACAGELHMEIVLQDLRDFLGEVEIVVQREIVTLKETISKPSSLVCLAKSPNGHNRIYTSAKPFEEGLAEALENGTVSIRQDSKDLAKQLATTFNWDVGEAKKIWSFGPERVGPNILVDCTKGVQYMNEIRDNFIGAFQWATKAGVLAEEEMRGIRFDINDAVLHADVIHRGSGQIIPAARRSIFASQLTAGPRLMEPVYLAEIVCPTLAVSGIYSVLNQRRGVVIENIQKLGTPLITVKAHLPVIESFGFSSALRAATSGQAFPQLVFDHWQVIEDDPLESGKARDMVVEIRTRKGLSPEIPPLDRFLDKL